MTGWDDLTPPYATIVADPPWHYGNALALPTRVGRVLKVRGATGQYNTMPIAEIRAMPVGELAAANSHLYLWVTNGFLHDGFHVMESWGFTYKACLTWSKTGHLGLGYWFRNQTEHILFGVRGKLPLDARDIRTVFTAAKRGHSIKPEESFALIERASPSPRLELFARTRRPGWDSWGDELEAA